MFINYIFFYFWILDIMGSVLIQKTRLWLYVMTFYAFVTRDYHLVTADKTWHLEVVMLKLYNVIDEIGRFVADTQPLKAVQQIDCDYNLFLHITRSQIFIYILILDCKKNILRNWQLVECRQLQALVRDRRRRNVCNLSQFVSSPNTDFDAWYERKQNMLPLFKYAIYMISVFFF